MVSFFEGGNEHLGVTKFSQFLEYPGNIAPFLVTKRLCLSRKATCLVDPRTSRYKQSASRSGRLTHGTECNVPNVLSPTVSVVF